MKFTENKLNSSDGSQLHYYKWETTSPKAVVQITHGVGEHIGRYEHVAQFLQSNGFHVIGHDHRAHGKTAEKELRGSYSGSNLWEDAISDIMCFNQLLKQQYSGLPIILYGHSMGSLMARSLVAQFPKAYDGLVLSGTARYLKTLGTIGLILTSILKLFKGRKAKINFLKTIFFGEFNKPFKPLRTPYDWISSSATEVDRYATDPIVTDDFNLGLYIDLIRGGRACNENKVIQATPTNLPILMFSGNQDPVGEMGIGVKQVHSAYKDTGIEDLTLNLYEGRHEMINETHKEVVIQDLLTWLNERYS